MAIRAPGVGVSHSVLIFTVAFLPLAVRTVTVAVPFCSAVTLPEEETFATDGLSLFQVSVDSVPEGSLAFSCSV